METFKEKIYRIFRNHTTSDTAITRRQLEIELMTSDRMARNLIRKAKEMGMPIVSSSHEKGYWFSQEDYDKMTIPEYKTRVTSLMKVINANHSDDPNQITIDEVI